MKILSTLRAEGMKDITIILRADFPLIFTRQFRPHQCINGLNSLNIPIIVLSRKPSAPEKL